MQVCDQCRGGSDRRIECTAENVSDMLHEATHVALQASAAYANGWLEASKGFVNDMSATWGGPAMARMAYVWGAARYFLPPPPSRSVTLEPQKAADVWRRVTGEPLGPHRLARMVAQGDQLDAACQAVAQAASRGDMEALLAAMTGFDAAEGAMDLLVMELMSDAGMRLRHSRNVGDERAHELFMAHVHAALADDADDADEGGKGKGYESGEV